MTYISPEESAFGVSFLDRLEAGAKPLSLTQPPELEDILESIKKNVANVLNTRVGDSQSSQALGLIDFNDATLEIRDISKTIRLSIKNCLEEFEPRLTSIEIDLHVDKVEAGALRFQIKAQLNHDAIHDKVKLNLMLDQNKQYKVF